MKYVKVDSNNNIIYFNAIFEELTYEQQSNLIGGYQTDSIIPDEPSRVQGKDNIMKYNPDTDAFYWEQVDRPLSPDERIKQLEETVAQLMLG